MFRPLYLSFKLYATLLKEMFHKTSFGRVSWIDAWKESSQEYPQEFWIFSSGSFATISLLNIILSQNDILLISHKQPSLFSVNNMRRREGIRKIISANFCSFIAPHLNVILYLKKFFFVFDFIYKNYTARIYVCLCISTVRVPKKCVPIF